MLRALRETDVHYSRKLGRFIFAASVNTASQLATISRTTERPISERLRQLEHSKAENDVRL